MIGGLLWLLGCQLVGEVVVRVLGVTVPGPVVGMVLLLLVLRWRRVPTSASTAADVDTYVDIDPAVVAAPPAPPAPPDPADPAGRGAGLVAVADLLLSHLQLLFVPAGVGVVAYAGVLRSQALPLGVALVVSWAAGLLVVGLLVGASVRRAEGRGQA